MGTKTQIRVKSNTSRVLWFAVLFSLLLHAVPPVAFIAGKLSGFRWSDDTFLADVDHPTIIPIEFDLEDPDDRSTSPAQEAHNASNHDDAIPVLPPPARKPPTRHDSLLDAGAEDTSVEAGADSGLDSGRTDAPIDSGRRDARLDSSRIRDASSEDAPSEHREAAASDSPTQPQQVTDASSDRSVPQPDAHGRFIASADAGVTRPDAGAPGLPDGSTPRDSGPRHPQYRPIHDPVGLAGGAKQIAPKRPNVSLLIYPERIRRNALGRKFAPVLLEIPQWHDFFAGTGLDPIQNMDRILLAGPQFRHTSRVVAVVRHHMSRQTVRAAVDVLVRRSGPRGQWIKAPVPAAKVYVDRAERYFVLPKPHILVIVPPDGLQQALHLPKNFRFSKAHNEAVVLFLKTPRNAFRGLAVDIPATIAWLRLSATSNDDGSVFLRLDAKDKDAKTATRNATKLTDQINSALVIDLIFTKRRLLDHISFRADGDHIRTETRITQRQLNTLLGMIEAQIKEMTRRQK